MIDIVFFFKQKTAYDMRISDWSSDVCSSDLCLCRHGPGDLAVWRWPRGRADRRYPADQPRPGRLSLPDARMDPTLPASLPPEPVEPRASTALLVLGMHRRSDERRVGKECVSTCIYCG